MRLSRRRMQLARQHRRRLDRWFRQHVVCRVGEIHVVRLAPWYSLMQETKRGLLKPVAQQLDSLEDATEHAQQMAEISALMDA